MEVFVRTVARAILDDGAELGSALLHLLAPAHPIVRYESPLRALVALLRYHKMLLPMFVAKELGRDAIELISKEEGRLHSLYARMMEELAGGYVERCLGSILRQVAAGTVSDMPVETEGVLEEKPSEQPLQYTSFQLVLAMRNSLVYVPHSVRHAVELARAELSRTVHYTLVDRVVAKILLSLLFAPAIRDPVRFGVSLPVASAAGRRALRKLGNRVDRIAGLLDAESHALTQLPGKPVVRNCAPILRAFVADFAHSTNTLPMAEVPTRYTELEAAVLFCAIEKHLDSVMSWFSSTLGDERGNKCRRRLRDDLKVLRSSATLVPLLRQPSNVPLTLPTYLVEGPGHTPAPLSVVVRALQTALAALQSLNYSELTATELPRFFALAPLRVIPHLLRDLKEVHLEDITEAERVPFFLNLHTLLGVSAHARLGLPDLADRASWQRSAKCCVGTHNVTLWEVDRIILAGSPAALRKPDTEHLYRSSLTLPADVRLQLVRCEGTRAQPFLRVFSAENFDEELRAATAEALEYSVSADPQRREVLLPAVLDGAAGLTSPDAIVRWLLRSLAPHSRLRAAIAALSKDPFSVRFLYEQANQNFAYRLPLPPSTRATNEDVK